MYWLKISILGSLITCEKWVSFLNTDYREMLFSEEKITDFKGRGRPRVYYRRVAGKDVLQRYNT